MESKMEVGVRELKTHLSRYLALVRKGESVVVTDRGKAVARIERVHQQELPESVQLLVEEGRLAYKGSPRNIAAPSIRMLPGDKTLADYVSEQRH